MKKTLLLCLLSFLLPSINYAANHGGTASLSVAGGYYYLDEVRELKNTGLPLAMLGINFTDHWGIEGMVGHFITNFKPVVGDTQQIHGDLFAIDGVYHFCEFYHVQPYLMAGVGMLGINHSVAGANNEGNVNAGIGLQLFVDQHLALRADARDFYTITESKNDVMVNFGISILFDIC